MGNVFKNLTSEKTYAELSKKGHVQGAAPLTQRAVWRGQYFKKRLDIGVKGH